ncbi:hypothetical protein J2T38_000822 [Neisseria perflava]|uniref:DUF4422 domain-containing protein n=1 Tax=Neisseria perflava TaxID=33053 RepID=UPI0020A14DBF|nr:DUF4422 domain-containing protein [Neisseria perflava]MCP1772008.1 hypothetical protein [Neisseria perflava]
MQRLQPDLNIFVVTHKVFRFPKAIDGQIYTPVQVGTKPNLGYLQENQLDNIAAKNANFCELTALYFLWKNVRCPNAGLVHYRRYLMSPAQPDRIISRNEIDTLMADNDLILPEKLHFSVRTVRQQYAKFHEIEDWDLTRAIIAERQPDYLAAFDAFSDGKEMHHGNMFIGKKAVLDDYCAWLFDVLFELERRADIAHYSDYNKRVFGFLSERLLNVWLIKNAHVRTCEVPLYKHKENSNTFTFQRGKKTVFAV